MIENAVEPDAAISIDLENGCIASSSVQLTLHPLSSGVVLESDSMITVPAESTATIALRVTTPSKQAFEAIVVARSGEQTVLATVVGSVE